MIANRGTTPAARSQRIRNWSSHSKSQRHRSAQPLSPPFNTFNLTTDLLVRASIAFTLGSRRWVSESDDATLSLPGKLVDADGAIRTP